MDPDHDNPVAEGHEPKPPTFEYPSEEECSLLCFEHLATNLYPSMNAIHEAAHEREGLSLTRLSKSVSLCHDRVTGSCKGVICCVEGEGFCITWADGSGLTVDPGVALDLAFGGPSNVGTSS